MTMLEYWRKLIGQQGLGHSFMDGDAGSPRLRLFKKEKDAFTRRWGTLKTKGHLSRHHQLWVEHSKLLAKGHF